MDLRLHAGRVLRPEDPNFLAQCQQRLSEQQTEFALLRVRVIQNLWVQQMACYRDALFVDGEAGVLHRCRRVLFNVSGVL